ncbi:hypothetical protein Esi_0260_0013 [Ectocarpus siliculosus]|uniref:RGS domain-containing protein n=1 Tax=Ectocarpus siliculosus TaxID=2880 RepID=D7FTW2_ECTSI|nr:hypothetical protein Esi_0260_0013 [Ectocarpus siliculosus]|eukprot:CBJ31489.1 hypothetical protein Esi_0260_0013 [Ectocarpus siliculosus]
MVGGVAGILTMLVTVNDATTVIWDTGFDWFWTSLLLFFISPALFGSYICRALRLAVVFHPRVKRALPWLVPERNYMVVLLVSSVGMLAIPIYHEHTLGVWDAISKQTTILKIEARVLAVALACIYPFIRNVDDLFSISTELIIVTATIGLITTTRRNYANRVLPDHTEPHSIGGNRLDAVRRGQTERGDDRGRDGGRRSRSHKQDIDLWDFERIVRTPLLAVAFEDYSKRALCHESFLFLSEVSRYQNGDYATTKRASSGSSFPTQFGTFCYITDTFIKAGSHEEVNISDKERKLILALYHKGEELFEDVNVEERRMIFRRAYLAVKRMLEANLLLRFLNTDRFKSLEMQKENTQVMVDSPPQARVVVS